MNPTVYENLEELTYIELINIYHILINNIEKMREHFGTTAINSAYLNAVAAELERRNTFMGNFD